MQLAIQCTVETVDYGRSQKKETFCYYTKKILQYFVHKLQCVLRKTTNRTTRNYKSYYTKLQIVLHKTTDCITQNYRLYYTKLQTVLQILRSYYIKYTYLHTYMKTRKAIGRVHVLSGVRRLTETCGKNLRKLYCVAHKTLCNSFLPCYLLPLLW